MEPELKVYTLPQVADILQVHPNTANRYLNEGLIPGIKIGGRWRISRKALEKYLAGE